MYIYYPCLSRKYFLEAGIIYIHVHKQFNKIRNDVHNVGSSALPKKPCITTVRYFLPTKRIDSAAKDE